jgi:D-arabinose 1-dehydrogenase-like Zn-dependent alcohol dehydrogenase
MCAGDSVAVIGVGGVGSRLADTYAPRVLMFPIHISPFSIDYDKTEFFLLYRSCTVNLKVDILFTHILIKQTLQLCLQIAKAFGASEVIAMDVVHETLQSARKLGATHTVNAAKEDAVERIKVCLVPNNV